MAQHTRAGEHVQTAQTQMVPEAYVLSFFNDDRKMNLELFTESSSLLRILFCFVLNNDLNSRFSQKLLLSKCSIKVSIVSQLNDNMTSFEFQRSRS